MTEKKDKSILDWFVKPFVVSLAVGSVVLLCQLLWDLGTDVRNEMKGMRKATETLVDSFGSMRENYNKEIADLKAELEATKVKLKALEKEEKVINPFPIDALRKEHQKRLDENLDKGIKTRAIQREQQIQLIPQSH